ncbi:glycosyltransferase family 2 protein [Babesia caballi]|uniref:Glycosyltransferase family 2 protein n=1 Tax=Babesia caballi TaxID=5871 RepID=A0AAV4LU20_BABCB|nr:glycosyltransferase family 2 protein [Babesia caballi]
MEATPQSPNRESAPIQNSTCSGYSVHLLRGDGFGVGLVVRRNPPDRPPADGFDQLVDQNHGERPHQHRRPVVTVQGNDVEHLRQKGRVKYSAVDRDRHERGQHQVRVQPRRHRQQGGLLRHCVECVEHFDHDQHREAKRGRLRLSEREVAASIPGHARHVLHGEVLPARAPGEAHELLQGHGRVVVVGRDPVHVPPHKDPHRRHADVDPNHNVPDESPHVNQFVVVVPGRLLHDLEVRRVEAERSGRQPVGDEVDPKQLHGHHALGDAHGRRQENGRHLADIAGD